MIILNTIMPGQVVLEYSYLLSAIMFVIGLKLQSHPETARKGNFWAASGMILAMITTLILNKNGAGEGISFHQRPLLELKAELFFLVFEQCKSLHSILQQHR